MRAFHKKETRPWLAGAVDILAAANYWTYTEHMGELLSAFNDDAKPQFIEGLAKFRKDAKRLRGGFYDPADYPSAEELQRSIVASLHFMPLPNASDFRAAISADEIEKLRQSIEADVAESFNVGLKSMWADLYEVIEEMGQKLARYEVGPAGKITQTFRDSAVNNVREMVDRIGRLNVTADPEIEAMCLRVRQRLLAAEPDTLRTDEKQRAAAIDEAQRIMQAMAGFVAERRAAA